MRVKNNFFILFAAVAGFSVSGYAGSSARILTVAPTDNSALSIDGSYAEASQAAVATQEKGAKANTALLQTLNDSQNSTLRSDSSSYLSGTSGLAGEQLFQKLHDITGRNAHIQSYNTAKAYMYSTADNVTVNGVTGVYDAYSEVFIAGSGGDGGQYKENGDQNGDGVVDKQGVNAEHSWPQSFFKQALPMRGDLHHIQTTLDTPNNRRSNYPYAMVTTYTYSTNGGSKLGKEGFEPCDKDKGNTARALLYFMVRYYDQNIRSGAFNNTAFWTSKVQQFLDWNRQDPPDQNERNRNDLVEKLQGNRNPFIDDSTLADKIGADTFKAH